MRKSVVLLIIHIFLTYSFLVALLPVKAKAMTITVPDDYPTIQEAVAAAEEGATIYVKKGRYSGAISIDKSLTLIGEDKSQTVITEWLINGTAAIVVRKDNVNITGFTIHNPSSTTVWSPKRGIHLCMLKAAIFLATIFWAANGAREYGSTIHIRIS